MPAIRAAKETTMLRALVKIVLTYAVTRALSRAGGRGGLIDSVLGGAKKGGTRRRGGSRSRAR